jgi:hypothetical protein
MKTNFILTAVFALLIVFSNLIVFSQTLQSIKASSEEGLIFDKTRLEPLPCPGYSQYSDKLINHIITVQTKVLQKKELK